MCLLKFSPKFARLDLITVLLCVPPILAAGSVWGYCYYRYWRVIPREEAAALAQEAVVKRVEKLRAEGMDLRPVDSWRLLGTNAEPMEWSVEFRVIRPNSKRAMISFVVTNGSPGWAARNTGTYIEK